jgi:hypothetical protein
MTPRRFNSASSCEGSWPEEALRRNATGLTRTALRKPEPNLSLVGYLAGEQVRNHDSVTVAALTPVQKSSNTGGGSGEVNCR